MKRNLVVFILIFTAGISFAQITDAEKAIRTMTADSVDGWKKGITTFINVSQTSLTNWAAGGENSLSINGLINAQANLKKGESNWANSLEIGYGLLKQGTDAGFVKTDDKIELVSKYGYHAFGKWNYAVLFSFKTQMANGYNYPNDSVAISKFLAPGYILGAAGLDYMPNDNFSAFIAPITGKVTLVNDQALADSGAYGVKPGQKSRIEMGGYIRLAFRKDLFENVNFSTKIDLFSNYLDNPQNIDINWETLLTLKANKYLSATLSTLLIYDDNIKIEQDTNNDGVIDSKGPRIQFKEVLSIGITLQF